jgi:hypothetical protein
MLYTPLNDLDHTATWSGVLRLTALDFEMSLRMVDLRTNGVL